MVCVLVFFLFDSFMRCFIFFMGFMFSLDWNFRLFEDKMYFMWDVLVKCKIFDKFVIVKDW